MKLKGLMPTPATVNSDDRRLKYLLEKYLNGTASPEELQEIGRYADTREDSFRAWLRSEMDKELPLPHASHAMVDQVHRNLMEQIGAEIPAARQVWWKHPVIAAACVLLFLSVGGFFGYQRWLEANELHQVVTQRGERKKITLEDGSVVWMNAASSLRYDDFGGDKRDVFLEGEAFFEVTKDPERPFVIRSGELQTTVVGTSFNISAYKEDSKLAVSVVTGKVKVGKGASVIQLVPDQQAVFDRGTGTFARRAVAGAEGHAAWKEGRLQFRNATFSEVTAVLQRSYNVKIAYDPLLENCPVIHADFRMGEPIESILKSLLISVQGSVKEVGSGEYQLTGTVACAP